MVQQVVPAHMSLIKLVLDMPPTLKDFVSHGILMNAYFHRNLDLDIIIFIYLRFGVGHLSLLFLLLFDPEPEDSLGQGHRTAHCVDPDGVLSPNSVPHALTQVCLVPKLSPAAFGGEFYFVHLFSPFPIAVTVK